MLGTFWENANDTNVHNIDEEGLRQQTLKYVLGKAYETRTRRPISRMEKRRRSFFKARPLIYTAIVLCAVISALLYIKVDVPASVEIVENAPTVIGKENPRGIRSTFHLKDGTKVHLNAQSKLTYKSDYGLETRQVYLEGEAFFEVVKNPEKPFKVVSTHLTTTALGTSFNVRDYETDDTALIALATGRVEVERTADGGSRPTGEKYTLSPSEQVIFNKSSKQMVVNQFDPEIELAWKENSLNFKKTKLKDIITVLEQWYDVDIMIKGEDLETLLSKHGTGKFTDQSLEVVLSSLGYSMGFTSEINGGNVIIKSKSKRL